MLTTDYQNYIHLSRYSRYLPEKGRREFWSETVGRYFDFMEVHLLKTCNYVLQPLTRQTLEEAVLNLEIMPSMRSLMTAGPALERENLSGYNCAFLEVNRPKAFADTLYVLMCGTGLGFSVERQVIKNLPEIPKLQYHNDIITVEDSKEGWAQAYNELIDALYLGNIPRSFNTDKVRPAGAPLKTFGGRASGPKPLIDLFMFTIDKFVGAQGRRLNSIEAHDIMCKIGEVVVVGGVRRSAMISLSNLSDDRMRVAKSGNWWETEKQRALSNNSIAFTEKPDVHAFLKEFLAIYESRSGERGIFSRYGAQKKIKEAGRRDPNHEFGCNPCVVGDTKILTRQGYREIKTLIGKETEIWNGKNWSKVTPFSTGINSLVELKFSDGTTLICTPYHKFLLDGKDERGTQEVHEINSQGKNIYRTRLEAKNLKIGDKLAKFHFPIIEEGIDPEIDAYSQGFYSGDGNANSKKSWVYEPKYSVIPRLIGTIREPLPNYNRRDWTHGEMLDKRYVPLESSIQYKLNWLAGLLDSDGCVTNEVNGQGLQIVSVSEEFLLNLKLLLSTLGASAKVIPADEGRYGFIGEDNGTRSYFQPTSRILINCADTYNLQILGLECSRLKLKKSSPDRNAARFIKVSSIEELPYEEETFCFTEPECNIGVFNGLFAGNCAEILLRDRELCNLTEVVIRPNDNPASIIKKIMLATILGTFQSTLTNFQFVDEEWAKNCIEERLLGVSLTGIMDNVLTSGKSGAQNLAAFLERAKAQAIATNKQIAAELDINPSVAVTTVKPSGTVSQLVDCRSGIHAAHSEFYIRTVRSDNKDPLCKFMIDQGVPHEPCVMKPNDVTVFSFPVHVPKKGAIFRDDLSAIQHLEIVKIYNNHWAEHSVSVTVNLKEDEWPEVSGWVYRNFDALTGISFLPHTEHSYMQAPYQEVDEQGYRELVAKSPKNIDWSNFVEYETGEDTTHGAQNLACSGTVCEIVDTAG